MGTSIVMWDMPKLKVKKGGEHITKDCVHFKNINLHVQRGPINCILVPINRPICEGNQKIVQIMSMFHVLSQGHPMLEYELFGRLRLPNTLSMHWFDKLFKSLLSSCTSKFKRPMSRPFNMHDS
jgi:hypothetical protein